MTRLRAVATDVNDDITTPAPASRLRVESPATAVAIKCVLVCEDEMFGAEVAGVAVRAGVEFRATRRLTTEHIAYALRNHAILVLVRGDEAVESIPNIRAMGSDCPILVLEREMDDLRTSALIERGASACHDLSLTSREFQRLLSGLNERAWRRVCCPLWFDPTTHRVGFGESEVTLSLHEFQLLSCLVENAGEPVGAARLRLYAWGAEVPKKSEEQIVAVHMCRLRKKLEQLQLGDAIIAQRGHGYVLQL